MQKLILVIILILPLTACNKEIITFKARSTERVVSVTNGSSSSKYLVFTDKGVFANGDNLLFFKFNSSDIQNMIKVGDCYEAKTRFWRIPFLSMYKNIMQLREIECTN